jgi:hypothetical protein
MSMYYFMIQICSHFIGGSENILWTAYSPCIFKHTKYYLHFGGRAIAQAVSRWFPTAAVRGSSPGLVVWDFVVDKAALG